MGSEYACVQDGQTFGGPSDDRIIHAWKSWKINAVRLPMNEDCWLGLHDAPMQASQYRREFIAFCQKLLAQGLVVVLDLHWTSHDSSLATDQDEFLSANSLKFWRSVASQPAFRNVPGVVFEVTPAIDGTLSQL